MIETDLSIINNRSDIKTRIYENYSKRRAKTLYDFYLLIIMQGIQEIKRNTDKSSYYKNISDLKKIGVDFSQKLEVDLADNILQFNPFEEDEVL